MFVFGTTHIVGCAYHAFRQLIVGLGVTPWTRVITDVDFSFYIMTNSSLVIAIALQDGILVSYLYDKLTRKTVRRGIYHRYIAYWFFGPIGTS
jgi:hypothetical protein